MKFDQNMPIYLQIMEHIEYSIISGKYHSGERMDTVRDLAVQYCVNPNTVQRALSELERDQLVFSERTNGRFITNDCERIGALRSVYISEKVDAFIKEMKLLGIEDAHIIEHVKGRLNHGE